MMRIFRGTTSGGLSRGSMKDIEDDARTVGCAAFLATFSG